MPLTTQQTLDAYESGIEAAFDHDVRHEPMRECPYPLGSDEEREWLLGVEQSRGDLHIKNKRLRQLRRRLAQEGGRYTEQEWQALCAEFGFRCVRCGCHPAGLERDHIIPIYKRGTEAITNIQPLCKTCNTAKGPEDIDWVAFRRQHGFRDHELLQVSRDQQEWPNTALEPTADSASGLPKSAGSAESQAGGGSAFVR